MKIRNGFVSNSSSSSFIIGIANVLDDKKAGDFVFEPYSNNLPYNVDFRVIDTDKGLYEVYVKDFKGGRVSVEAKAGDSIVYLDEIGNVEDSDFWDGDEYDYDIDIEDGYFREEDLSKYQEIINLGGNVRYGAGRDG